jgi:hypothetical protein
VRLALLISTYLEMMRKRVGIAQLEADLRIPVFACGIGTVGGRPAYLGVCLWEWHS